MEWWNSSETRQLWHFDLKYHDTNINYSRFDNGDDDDRKIHYKLP